QEGCTTALPVLDTQFQNVNSMLKKIEQAPFSPDDPIFQELETLLFEMAPVVSACSTPVMDYTELIAKVRFVVKEQSVEWDMRSAAAPSTLYRLLYGSRAAAEEAILQSSVGEISPLVYGQSEPSQTPFVNVYEVQVHSGDILVSRGGASTSALIARGNDYPGNFSHIALVYVDPDTHTPFIVEAHIEQGTVVSTLEQYLKDKKLRIVLLRPRADLPQLIKDPLIPHKAAELLYTRATTEHIAYDFEMNYKEHQKLFCSEVASSGYDAFGITLWTNLSRISSPGLQRWLNAFGVQHFETQEPSDLEYDPQFTVVAEWHDRDTLKKDHYDNAVTDVMLEGAEQGDELSYKLYLLPFIRIAKVYSALLNTVGMTGPVPEGMSPQAALRNMAYTKKHEALTAELAKKALLFKKQNGYEPPYWELVRLARSAKQKMED
ncbi:MAG: YiiX/YebB-like N1pC/P60 family cysteine hydrolase, partial [Campylobacterota bacterium]